MTSTTDAPTTSYAIDPAHSRLGFAVRHMMLTKVRGEFTSFHGSLQLGASEIPQHLATTIEIASISTNEKDRDTHLKSPDFFDAATYSTMNFESTNIQANGTEHFTVLGNLTIHGVTKAVELKGIFEGKTVDPWGKNRIAYSATTRINRKDFGLVWNQTLETGGLLVGEEIEITLEIQAVA